MRQPRFVPMCGWPDWTILPPARQIWRRRSTAYLRTCIRFWRFTRPDFLTKRPAARRWCLPGTRTADKYAFRFLPVLWLPRDSGHYLEGWYGANGSKMYVSRGIGLPLFPFDLCAVRNWPSSRLVRRQFLKIRLVNILLAIRLVIGQIMRSWETNL